MSLHRRASTFIIALLVGSFSLSLMQNAEAQDFPPASNKLVNDYTNTLSRNQLNGLEQKLVAFDDSTSIQIAVVVMKSTGQYEIADFTVRLAQHWGVGSKENDTGIMLLVALEDRSVTIQTGYGIEGAVPDAIAFRIIENEIKPAFRQENYYQGIDQATDALIAYTKGEYKATPKEPRRGRSGLGTIIMVIVFVVIMALIGNSRGGGGNDGEVLSRRGASDALWWSILLGSGGRGRGGRGRSFGGGGFSGGGFGGFGGGGFGGGGASGRW